MTTFTKIDLKARGRARARGAEYPKSVPHVFIWWVEARTVGTGVTLTLDVPTATEFARDVRAAVIAAGGRDPWETVT